MVKLVLCCCSLAFPSWDEWGLLSSCGARSFHGSGVSGCGEWALGHTGFSSCSSPALEHRFNSCGARAQLFLGKWICPDQGSRLCLLRGQADSPPLSLQGSPSFPSFLQLVVGGAGMWIQAASSSNRAHKCHPHSLQENFLTYHSSGSLLECCLKWEDRAVQTTSLLILTSVCWAGVLWAVPITEESPPFKTPWSSQYCEALILWPPDEKNWLIGKTPDVGKDWRQEEKRTTEDEMAGWHHQLDGHEFEQVPGVGDGQGSLVCCSPWGRKESDMTEWLNWTDQVIDESSARWRAVQAPSAEAGPPQAP